MSFPVLSVGISLVGFIKWFISIFNNFFYKLHDVLKTRSTAQCTLASLVTSNGGTVGHLISTSQEQPWTGCAL